MAKKEKKPDESAIYREWRPKVFRDVLGQEHITKTIKNQVVNNKLSHAYLLCGTRGTGKTTTAKIMAKAANCLNPIDGEPCNECENCKRIDSGRELDIIEMDAASKNKVDDIRDIIDEVKYPPQNLRYKVYIIDEVHMLTTQASNAFLKTLEEPPANIMFILATTDPQKLPITILSRCQRFDFKMISSDLIFDRMVEILKAKKIQYDEKAVRLVSRLADGSMRDGLSILDPAISMGNNKVVYEDVVTLLGIASNQLLLDVTDCIIEKNTTKALGVVEQIFSGGKDIGLFTKDLIIHLRNLMIMLSSEKPKDIINVTDEDFILLEEQAKKMKLEEISRCMDILQNAEYQIKTSNNGKVYFELAVIKMCKIQCDSAGEALSIKVNKLEEKLDTILQAIKQGIPVINTAAIVTNQGTIAEKIEDIEKKIDNIQPTIQKEEVLLKSEETNALDNTTKEVQSFVKDNTSITNEVTKGNDLNPIKPENDATAQENPSQSTIENGELSEEEYIKNNFKTIIECFKKVQMVLYASLFSAEVISFKNNVITLGYEKEYIFNKERLETPDVKTVVEKMLSTVLKTNIKINYIIIEPTKGEHQRNPNKPQGSQSQGNHLVNKAKETLLKMIGE